MGNLFINNQFKAKNVLEIIFNFNLIKDLIEEIHKDDLFTVSPLWNSDIKWISNNSLRSYGVFEDYFNKLQLPTIFKRFVEYKKSLILYSGFLFHDQIVPLITFILIGYLNVRIMHSHRLLL